MDDGGELGVRGLLIHVTHYDPAWCRKKEDEKPFDAGVATAVARAAAEGGLNLLVIDCADGVKYRSHPELERHYTVPMQSLRDVLDSARGLGLELVPKLNFAQSHLHHHNDWFRPHHELRDSDEYWRLAFEIIDELIEEIKPPRFFHVGMDEDHDRSHAQYARAIERLHSGLKERGLRAVVWNDSAHEGTPWADVHAEKCRAAEERIPKDVVEVLWSYRSTASEPLKRLVDQGFEVWGAPGATEEQVRAWRKDITELGGKGLLLTRWIPMTAENRDELVDLVKRLGPLTAGE